MMNSKVFKLGTIALALNVGIGCSDSDGNSSSPSITGTNAVFTKATNALTSVYATTSSFSAPLNNSINPLMITCTSGAPDGIAVGDANYAGEDVFCILNSNSKSPDTVQGSYFIIANVLCAVEKSISFVYAGTPTNHNNIQLSETDSCFGSGFDINDDGDTLDTIPMSLQDIALTGSDYDYSIGIQLGALSFTSADIQFYLKDSGGIQAARVYQEGSPSVFEVVINSNNNSFYYENWDYSNERHIRLAAVGAFDPANGSFTAVTSTKYIHTERDISTGDEFSVIMDFDGATDSYSHHINGTVDPDYSDLGSIPHNTAFYDWSGKAVTDHTPATDSLLDLSTFDMSVFR